MEEFSFKSVVILLFLESTPVHTTVVILLFLESTPMHTTVVQR